MAQDCRSLTALMHGQREGYASELLSRNADGARAPWDDAGAGALGKWPRASGRAGVLGDSWNGVVEVLEYSARGIACGTECGPCAGGVDCLRVVLGMCAEPTQHR